MLLVVVLARAAPTDHNEPLCVLTSTEDDVIALCSLFFNLFWQVVCVFNGSTAHTYRRSGPSMGKVNKPLSPVGMYDMCHTHRTSWGTERSSFEPFSACIDGDLPPRLVPKSPNSES